MLVIHGDSPALRLIQGESPEVWIRSQCITWYAGLRVQTIPWVVKPVENPSKKPASNLIQFLSVMPVIIKDFFMFKALLTTNK